MLKIAQLMFIILMFTHPHTPHTSPPPEELGVGPTLPHPIGYSILFEKWYKTVPHLGQKWILTDKVLGTF